MSMIAYAVAEQMYSDNPNVGLINIWLTYLLLYNAPIIINNDFIINKNNNIIVIVMIIMVVLLCDI